MTTVTTDSNGVKNYTSSAASLNDTSTSTLSQKTLDQTDFLTLLTTQLQAQDPLNPVSNADLVAQMATITTTSGISEMNTSLGKISSAISSMQNSISTSSRFSDAASWIGHNMMVKSDVVGPSTEGTYNGQFTLSEASDNVQVSLVDSSGNTVRTIDLGAQAKGDVSFSWDGKDDDGNYIAGDVYQVQVSGAEATDISTWNAIAAVQSPADSSSAKLITAIGSFDPDDALKLI